MLVYYIIPEKPLPVPLLRENPLRLRIRRIGSRGEKVPRQRNRRKNRETQRNPRDVRLFQRPQKRDRPDEPLRHDRQRAEREKRDGQRPAPYPRTPQRHYKAEHCGRYERGDSHVERDDLPERVVEQKSRQKRGGEKPRPPIVEGAGGAIRGANPENRHQRIGETRRELARAENFKRRRLHPVEHRRLVEIRHVVKARGCHVGVREHFARNLRIPSLVGAREGAREAQRHVQRARNRENYGQIRKPTRPFSGVKFIHTREYWKGARGYTRIILNLPNAEMENAKKKVLPSRSRPAKYFGIKFKTKQHGRRIEQKESHGNRVH